MELSKLPARDSNDQNQLQDIGPNRKQRRERTAELEARNERLERLFAVQRRRSFEAGELWRSAHPGNDLTSPDLGELLQWLMARADAAEKERDAAFAMSKCECGPDEACRNLAEQHVQIAALKAELQRLQYEKELIAEGIGLYQERAETAEARESKMRKALEPFIEFANQIDEWRHEDESTCLHRIKASDLRRARAALQEITNDVG